MDLLVLKNELTNDPLARGYSEMSDEQAAISLNTLDRNPNRTDLTGGMLAASIVRSELSALTNPDQNYVRSLLPVASMPLTNTLKAELNNIFPSGTQTRANVINLLKRPGSRAEELDLGFVTPSNVADARRL